MFVETITRQGRLNRLLSGVGVLIDNGRRHKVPSSQALKQSLLLRQVSGCPSQSPPFSGAAKKPTNSKNILLIPCHTVKQKKWRLSPFIPPPSRIPSSLAAGIKGVFKSFPRSPILRGKVGGFISWVIVFTLLWQNMIWAGPGDAQRNNNLAPSSRLGLLAREGVLRQIVLIIAAHPQIERLMQLQGQLENAGADERERLQGQWERGIRIIEDELARDREGLRVSLKDILFSEDGIIIRMRVDGLDLYAQVNKRGEVRIDTGPYPVRKLIGQPLGISAELSIVDGFFERAPDYKGLDYIVISDNPGGVVSKDGIEAIREIRERFPEEKFNFMLTVATKTRSLEEIKEKVLAGYRLGVKNFLIVSGDLPGEGPDSIQAIQYLKDDRTLPTDIRLGAVENPFGGPSLHERINRLEKKILAGADFIITQAVFDLDRFRAWMRRVRNRGLHRQVHIWAGFMPVRDAELLKRLVQKLGLHLPAVWFNTDMQENYREILEGLVREEGLSGIHIMPLKGSRRLAGYSEVIRKYPAQSVIGRFDLERARRLNRIEELGFEQVNKLRIEGDSVLYKRDGGLPSYPVVLLRAPLNSKPAIDALVGLLEKLDLDRFNLRIYLYKEEAPIPAPHHPGLVSGLKGEGASPYVLDFNIYDYEGENISSGFRDYLNKVQLEINYKVPWWYKALLGVLWFFSIERLYKIPFLGCIKCGQCVLTTTALICIMRYCAKQMRNGPCGDLLPDGRCRLGGECAWHKIHQRLMRWKRYSQWFERRGLYLLANFFDREPLLRQILAPWYKGLSGTSSQLNALRGIIKGVEFFGRQRAALKVEIPGSRDLARDIRRAFRHGGYLAVLGAIDRFHNSKEKIIADIKSWEEKLKERKKDLAFRERAHREIEGLVYKFYNFVDKDDLKSLREILKGAAMPSGEKIWDAFKRITPIEVLDGVTGVIGEMPIGAHLRETVENINRLVRFNEEDKVHFVDLQPEHLAKLKESMDTIWQNEGDRVILYLASILHDYGMFLRNYGTNSHAVDGERMIKPLIDRLVQNGIITQEQGEIILALIGGHVLIRVALGYIPPRNVFRGLIDLVVQERFLRCLRIMYFSDCAATPLFQSVDLMNEMARRTIKYTDRETISNLDRLRLLLGGKDIGHVEPWLAEFLDRATFDMPTEVLLFTQLEPDILIKFLYYLDQLRKHFDTAPDFLFVINNDSSGRITGILEPLDFSQITPSTFPAKLDRGQIAVHVKDERPRPGSPETANEIIKRYFIHTVWFTLNDYLERLDEVFGAPRVIAKITARRDLEQLHKRGWLEIDKSRRPYKYRVSEKPLEQEEDHIKKLEKRLKELPRGKVITFIFDMDGTLVTDEGKRPDGATVSETLEYHRAVSYGTPEIFRLLKRYGHKIGIVTDASMCYVLFFLRQLGVDPETIDYLMPVRDYIGNRLAKDIAEAYGWQDVGTPEEMEEKLRGLGITIIKHPRERKAAAFNRMVSMANPESVVVCDDREWELERMGQVKGTVRNFIGINCKEEFNSLANSLNNALWFIDQDVAYTIVRVQGYRPIYVSPALYRELLPKARIAIREDREDPMAEYLLGTEHKAMAFREKIFEWLFSELDIKQLKIMDASSLVANSSSNTASAFKVFIYFWAYWITNDRKFLNLHIAMVNMDPHITRADILKAVGFEEKQLGVRFQIVDFSKEPDPKEAYQAWLAEARGRIIGPDGRITIACLDTPEHKEFYSPAGDSRLIPVEPPADGGFISGSAVLASVLMDRPDFIDTMPESMREELKGILFTAEGGLRVPAFRYSESHLPIEREGEEYTDRGELLVKPTPVLEIDRSQLEKLGMPDTGELLKAIRKVISFYQIYGERDVQDYWVDIRKGLKRPLEIRGRTITIDIDLLKVPTDYLFPFLLHLAGHEGGHSLFTIGHLPEIEEEAIVLFIDALRFSRHTRRVQDAIIGAFRSLKGLVDTRYIEFLESLRKDPDQDLAELIKNTLGIDTRYLEMRIFKNGESPVGISGIDELFSSFKYQKVKWSVVITRKEYYGQVRIRKKVVLFDEKGHLITDEGGNGIEFQYGLGLNSLYWNSVYLKPEHQRDGLGTELAEKIEEFARINAFGEEYPSAKIELTPREEKRGYLERLGYRGETGRRDVVEKRLDINRDYFGLAQRIVPLIIPHIDPDAVSQNLPEEGPWDGKKYTHAELLYFISQDSSGSVASVILDAILSRIGLEPLLGLPDIDITPSEKTLLQTRLKQLNLDEKNQALNDILDTIYLRSQRFVDYIPRANAVIRLEDFKESLSQYYLLVDIARLDETLAKKLIELRKQGRIARIVWSSPDIADEEEIRDKLDEFEVGLYNIRDLVIPRLAVDYTDYLKQILRKNRIPMDRLIVIATEESYDAVYRHIGGGLRDVKLSLTVKEFNFLIPHLPGDIVDRFKLVEGRYLLELDPLEEDPRGCIEGLEEAQRELAKAA